MICFATSHITSEKRIELLKKMIESLLLNNIKDIYISISFDKEFKKCKEGLVSYFEDNKEIGNFHVFYSEKPLDQFDHFHNILLNYKEGDEKHILFMNDDELLLRLPENVYNYDIIKGYQYVPENTVEDKTEDKDIKYILEIEEFYKDKWSKYVDFCGYICKFKYLMSYFIQRQNIICFEETKFMKYLNSYLLKVYTPTFPFIFHRLWN